MFRKFKTHGRVTTHNRGVPMVAKGLPKIPVFNGASFHAQMPDMRTAETANTGIAKIGGRITGSYPKIRGFNGGPAGSLEQPLVTSTSDLKGYL